MENSKWQVYEEKRKEIKKRYKRLRRNVWLICIPYIAVSEAIILYLCGKQYPHIAILASLFNVGFALVLAFYKTNYWRNEEEEKSNQVIEEAPVGRFKI
ncbi:MAG: hypothetical protein E7560_03940 [Ruminococcaceae bacterium]|nr:hypothetical protein [Oscillospiraceae bacterium]